MLAYLGPHIQHGEIQVVNEGARILRMSPELRIHVQQSYSIPLEEYSPQRRLDLPSEPPPKTGPQEHAVRPPDERDLWHLRAVGLLARGKRRSGIGSGKGVNIAIIDTGADGRHPEISGKILQALALDSTGRIGPVDSAIDHNGHGTVVCSLIAGETMGVAPDSRLISIQVLDKNGSGSTENILAGLEWVANASVEGRPLVRIVVLCLGSANEEATPRPALQSAMMSLINRGILPIVAVGNNGPGIANSPGDSYGIVSVGATTRASRIAEFSGSGGREFSGIKYSVPSLVAPGEDVFSATIIGNGYVRGSGATPATAIVAGVAALVAERAPELDARALRDRLLSQCRRLRGEDGERQGAGLIQVQGRSAR